MVAFTHELFLLFDSGGCQQRTAQRRTQVQGHPPGQGRIRPRNEGKGPEGIRNSRFGNSLEGSLIKGTFNQIGIHDVRWISLNMAKQSGDEKRWASITETGDAGSYEKAAPVEFRCCLFEICCSIKILECHFRTMFYDCVSKLLAPISILKNLHIHVI